MPSLKTVRTLVVEDDPAMRRYYARLFEELGGGEFKAVIVEDAECALGILRRQAVDLVVLDWNLPGISGETLLRALRASPNTRSLGVLMVTGKCAAADEVQALDSGADDHLAKPFDEGVLLARMRSVCRRRDLVAAPPRTGGFPELIYEADSDTVSVQGRRVLLTPKETGLLAIFLRRPDTLLTHSFLWDSVWGYESDNWEHLLFTAMSSLRRKLGAAWGDRITCHKGRGYAFEPPR